MTPAERWAVAVGVAVESAKVFVLLLAALIGWLVAAAPSKEGFMDTATLAATLMLVGLFGSLAIIMYGLYRIWRG